MEYNIPTIFNNNFLITQFFGQNLVDYKRFGMNGHNGVDLIPTNGESWDINSVSDGAVIQTGNDAGGFGNFIKIKDGNKVWLYAHLATFCVEKHQLVKKGQLIGIMGNTGNSTGAHLHLGLKLVDNEGNTLNNQNGYFGAIDPLPYLLETPVVPPEPPTPPTPQAPKDVPWKGNSYYEGFITSNNIALAVKDLTDRDIEIAALKAERDILKQEGQDWVAKVSLLEAQKRAIEQEKNILANELTNMRQQPELIPVVETPIIPLPEINIPKVDTVIIDKEGVNSQNNLTPSQTQIEVFSAMFRTYGTSVIQFLIFLTGLGFFTPESLEKLLTNPGTILSTIGVVLVQYLSEKNKFKAIKNTETK